MKSKTSIDVGLAALVKHAYAEQTMLREDIADVCECSLEIIRRLEKKAINKLKDSSILAEYYYL